jgi:hypothetical protein
VGFRTRFLALAHEAKLRVGVEVIRIGSRLAGVPTEAFDLSDSILGEPVKPGDPMDVHTDESRRMLEEGSRRVTRPAVEPPKPLAGSLAARFPGAVRRR